MPTGSSRILPLGRGGWRRGNARRGNGRKARIRWLTTEGLESRTLLTTTPAATATGSAVDLSNLSTPGLEYGDSPTVEINPYNSQEVVAVWVVDLPDFGESFVQGDYTIDGGATWDALPGTAVNSSGLGEMLGGFAQATDPSVGFDSLGDFYVLDSQHSAIIPSPTASPVPSAGVTALSKFTFAGTGAGATVTADYINDIVYQWVSDTTGDAALNPVIAVDPGTYPDTTATSSPPAGIPRDPEANNVYIAWVSNDIASGEVDYTGGFNPNRIELIVSSDGGRTFSGVTTVNPGGATSASLGDGVTYVNPDDGNNADFDTDSPQDDAHVQLLVDPEAGRITVGWENLVTGALQSNTVTPGNSYASSTLTDSIGNLYSPVTADPGGDWVQPVPSTSIYDAGPDAGDDEDPVAIAVGDVNGDGKDDIVVADDNTADGGIGVLLNSGTGTFPAAGATVYPAGDDPTDVILDDLVSGHTADTILDAAVANDSTAGGVSVLENGTPPNDGAGVFNAPTAYAAGAGTDALAIGNFDGSGDSIVAVNKDSNSVTILNPATGVIEATLTTGLDAPIAVAVGTFSGGTLPDIAVLNSNDTIEFFLDESTAAGDFKFAAVTATVGDAGLPSHIVAMAAYAGGGGSGATNLVLLTDNPGNNSLYLLQNQSTPGPNALNFDSLPIEDSGFAGTPVGVATGALSPGGTDDIAVLYAADAIAAKPASPGVPAEPAVPAGESMVAVFRDLGTNLVFQGRFFGLDRTEGPSQTGDWDAGQTNPTAIAVADLSGGKWDDIVVANDDGRGTISVLQPATPPTPPTGPLQNTFPVSVDVSDPTAITALTVDLALTTTSLADLTVTLVAPNGDSIVLMNPNVTGTELGVVETVPDLAAVADGLVVPVVFDDNATRDIVDASGQTTILGNFRPQSDYLTTETLDQFVQGLAASGHLNGQWTIQVAVSTATSSGLAGFLQEFALRFTSGMKAGATAGTISPFSFNETVDGNVFQTIVLPGALGDFELPSTTIASPVGIGPGLVMAEDTTEGPDSTRQGRIYAAFVGYYNVASSGIPNPADDTDIFEVYSDDGGATWSDPVQINDADADTDGYSGTNLDPSPDDEVTGRVTFQPAIAVDEATGTVVISWRDARDDPSNARVATYIAYSVDGGQTFGAETYANPSQTAVNAITGQTEVLGPESDNQSTGKTTTTPPTDTLADAVMGYGTQMGLAVFNGQLYPIWAGNLNQGVYDPLTNTVIGLPLNIYYRPMTVAAGPRVVSSTMGPITLAEAQSGSVAISVTFDRPIDPSSFVTGDVEVFYHDTTEGDPFVPVEVTGITAIGDSRFTITFDPAVAPDGSPSGVSNFTGTYSYLIAPDNGRGTAIVSPIWSWIDGALREGDPMDQNADGTTDENALTTSFTGLSPGDVYAVPTPEPIVPTVFDGAASILSPPFNEDTLPLIVPGPQVVSTEAIGTSAQVSTGDDDLLLNDTSREFQVTFDRPMQVSTFTSNEVLQITGPVGPITGPQTFTTTDVGAPIPAATSAGSGVIAVPLTIPDSDGTFKIADLTVELSAAFATDSSLTAVLIAPDGTEVPLFSGVGGTGADFVDTVLSDAATVPIATAAAPFTGTFRPEYPMMATETLTGLDGKVADGTWELQITNASTAAAGVLDDWSLSITPRIVVTPVDPVGGLATTFDIGFPRQVLSGTYTVQIGPNILDQFGDAVDANENAGLDVLRGEGQNSPTTTVQYTAGDTPVTIPAPSETAEGQATSSITVPDSFLVQGDTTSAKISGLRVQLNIAYPDDADLTATLYYDYGGPEQVGVQLFSGVGGGSSTADFTDTILDDNAGTPIQEGSAPFFSTFNPQLPLSAFAGLDAQGTWTLVVDNAITGSGQTGTIDSWSLAFQKPLPTSGLGEPGSDDLSTSFRIFTLGQADALSAEAWTPVGPAAIGSGGGSSGGGTLAGESSSGGASGRVTGIAVDPSDPSGNTVYAAGASGGVWKTTDFLTTSPAGPTWIPLTNFGPTDAVNIGSIAVFGRNNDPRDTIIVAATGEGNTGSPGVGFLVSTDGGQTWTLDDSTDNVDASGNPLPIDSPDRDREFVGDSAYAVTIDPELTPGGQVIIYAAMSGPNGGIWRSEDTGATWQLMLAGQATDVVLDADSGEVLDPTTRTEVQGNLQIVYAAIRGAGVFMSPNQGQVWNQMLGGVGNPLIDDEFTSPAPNVNPVAGPTPNGAEGRIELAVPAQTGNAAEDPIYDGWLYAAVAAPDGTLYGLFITKDFGENWTEIQFPSLPPIGTTDQAIPTNDTTQPNYAITGGGQFAAQGNYDLILAVDPSDPNVIYLGGSRDGGQTGLIRIDTTDLWDAHALVAYSDSAPDGGGLDVASTGPAAVDSLLYTDGDGDAPGVYPSTPYPSTPYPPPATSSPFPTQYLDYIRNPDDPFLSGATLQVYNYADFTNSGAGADWIPFDMPGTDYHSVAAMIDPTTGVPRLIFGNDQGIWSVLDDNGTFETQIGNSDELPGINRNGNLQITQFYYGAAQPSTAAALVAGALFYGSAQDNGGPVSSPSVIGTGDITWTGPGGDATGVGTDQQGSGTAYQFFWPCCGGDDTNFFQYIPAGESGTGAYVGRTYGLLQTSDGLPTPDPQWPFEGGANFAVDPVNSSDVVISSSVGRIFATSNQGVSWFDIGDPSVFGNPGNFSVALAYGAPDPTAPEGIGNLGNFIYVGTAAGSIYVTQDGGGSGSSNNWIDISTGLDGSAVEQIIADPTRGSHDAYAVTQDGVYFIADSIPSASDPTPTWIPIDGNLKSLAYSIFGESYNPADDTQPYDQAVILSSIVADWRYAIPNNPSDPSEGYHPVLYVGANSGVFQSLNNGQTWTLFPDTTYGALANGGDLPHVSVSSLSLSLGDINANTGMSTLDGPDAPNAADQTTAAAADPDTLMAATYGEGEFAINLAPLIIGDTVSVTGATAGTDPAGLPGIDGPVTIDGTSEITGFGDATWITVEDVTDPADPVVVAGFNPADPIPTPGADNSTDELGNFTIPFNPEADYTTDGVKTIEIFATDNAGSVGNVVTYKFDLNPPSQLVFAGGGEPPATAPAGQNLAAPSPIIVDVDDALGGISNRFDGPVTLTLANGATGTIVGTLTVDAVDGVATFTDVAIDTVGTYELDASSPDVADGLSTSIAISPAAPAQVVWTVEPPSEATEGVPIGATAEVEDQYGNLETGYTSSVSLSLDLNGQPDAADLGGTRSIAAVDGVATFPNIIINNIGDPFTLVAASGRLTSPPSSAIDVVAPTLVADGGPEASGSITAGTGFTLTWTAQTYQGTVDTDFDGTVVLAIASGPAGATLLGTASAAAVNGVATFNDVILDTAGTYSLQASSGNLLPGVVSVDVVAAAPVRLSIEQQPPGSVQAGVGFGVAVEAEDRYGNPTALTGSVAVAIGLNPGGSSLGGTSTVNASGGVATFSGLTLDKVGSGYTLVLESATLGSVTTGAIAVTPAAASQLVVAAGSPPATVDAGQTFSLVVDVEDQYGNLATGFDGSLSISSSPGGVAGPSTATADDGVATVSGLAIDTAGTYRLDATSGPLTVASNPVVVVPNPQASRLVWATEPPSQVYHGVGFGAVLDVEDQYGNVESGYDGSVAIALDANPTGSTLGGTIGVTASGGVATFSDLTLSNLGDGETLAATGDGLTSPASTTIDVTPIPPTALQVATQPPSTVHVAQAFGLSISILDQAGDPDPDFDGSVTVSLAPSSGANTLAGTTTVTASEGVANFSGLTLADVGSVSLQVSSGGLSSITTGAIDVTAATASQLVVVTQPPATLTAGATFNVEVKVEDRFGNLDTGFDGGLTAAVSNGASLGGITTVSASDGVADFTGLSVDLAGSGYTIAVTGSGVSPVTTGAFSVTPSTAAELVIATPPSATVTAGAPFGLAFAIADAYGNVETSASGQVAIGLSTDPGNGVLNGTLTATATNGVATFSGLTIVTAASGYTIEARSGTLSLGTSGPIDVVPAAPTQLAVSVPPPTSMVAGSDFGLSIVAEDQYGNRATQFTGDVSIALQDDPGGAPLTGGPLTVAAVAGVASFGVNPLTLDTAGSGYTLRATGQGLTPVATGPITVTAGTATRLVVVTEPPSYVSPGSTFGFVVAAEDPFGNVDPTFSGQVSVAAPAGSGIGLTGSTSVAADDGIATFTGLLLGPASSPVALPVAAVGVSGTTTSAVSETEAAVVSFAVGGEDVSEAAGDATIELERTSGYQGAISVQVATSGGTAVAGVNYTAINQTIDFAAGQETQTVTIPILDVGTLASPVTVGVALSSPGSNVSLGTLTSATITIVNANQSTAVTGTPTPVTMERVQLVRNKRHQVTGIVLDFSGALDAPKANDLGEYTLIKAGKKGSFTARNARAIGLRSAVYDPANDTVTLTPSKKFRVTRPVELIVNGVAPSGLEDSSGRLIDGNGDGHPGSDAIAVITRTGATVNALAGGPAAVDRLVEIGELGGLAKPRRS